MIFVDEKMFRSDESGQLMCWREKGTRFNRNNINLTRHSGHISVNMFGWMWAYGVGELTEIEGRFTGMLSTSIILSFVAKLLR